MCAPAIPASVQPTTPVPFEGVGSAESGDVSGDGMSRPSGDGEDGVADEEQPEMVESCVGGGGVGRGSLTPVREKQQQQPQQQQRRPQQ